MQKVFSLVFLVLLVLCVGCKKSESPTNTTSAAAAIPTVTFRGPNTTSTDANAQITIAYATSMNGVMASSSVFAGLPPQQNGNTSTWTYGGGGMSFTFTGVRQNDGSYSWSYTFTGTEGGVSYTDFKLWEGTTSADGKNGTWTFYSQEHTGKTAELVYSTNASNVMTGTWSVYNSNGSLSGKEIIVNNPDNTGSVEIYSNANILTYRSVWAANGSGTWTTYNSTGVQTGTGTWN